MVQKNRHRATIKDVALQADVSIATVSKIINGKDDHISEETRQKVFEVIEDLGYVQNSMAKSLKETNTKTLGLVIPDIGNAFPEMAKGAQDEAFAHGYTMFFCSTDSNSVQEEKFLNVLKSKMVDGIIYVSSDYATSKRLLADISIPIVAIDRKVEKNENMGSVRIDNFAAMKDVAKYIVDRGCKKIAYITSDVSMSPGKERYEGFVTGLKEAGITFDKRLHYPGVFSVETGHIGAMTLLQRSSEIDCIVCGNDLIAIGAVSICQKLGKSVPEDVKIIGFDDIYISKYLNPELTTVRQDAYEMGKQAASMLIGHIENKSPLTDIILPYEIMERSTV